MGRGGKREGAGRPRTYSDRRSIPGDMLELIDAMLYQRKKHGIRKFEVTYETKAGIQMSLNTAPPTADSENNGKVRLYIDNEMRPRVERTERAVAVFVGDALGVKNALEAMRKGMDLETFEFLAEMNGLTKES